MRQNVAREPAVERFRRRNKARLLQTAISAAVALKMRIQALNQGSGAHTNVAARATVAPTAIASSRTSRRICGRSSSVTFCKIPFLSGIRVEYEGLRAARE